MDHYTTPDGYGDYYFCYVYNPAANGLVSGESYSYLPIEIQDDIFILRAWGGAESCLSTASTVSTWGKIQLYDAQTRLFFDLPVSVFSPFSTGTAVLPEKEFPANSALRFDLSNTSLSQDSTSTVPTSQLAFHGVRRAKGRASDPTPSPYPYREQDFTIPFTAQLVNPATASGPGAPTQFTVPIQDYDFELRRIEYASVKPGFIGPAPDTVGLDWQQANVAIPVKIQASYGNAVLSVTVTYSGGAATVTVNFTAPNEFVGVDTIAQVNAAVNAGASAVVRTTIPSDVPPTDTYEGSDMPISLSATFLSSPNPLFPEFQMTLYDSNWRARSNSPVNCNRLLHYSLGGTSSPNFAPMNSFPSPGILYPVNSVIRFDLLSLLPSSAVQTAAVLAFKGVQRIPC
jgi:hypothetical protein